MDGNEEGGMGRREGLGCHRCQRQRLTQAGTPSSSRIQTRSALKVEQSKHNIERGGGVKQPRHEMHPLWSMSDIEAGEKLNH